MCHNISGRLIAAARALAGVSLPDFAAAARLPVDTMRDLEAAGSAFVTSEQKLKAIHEAFKHFGVLVVDESDGLGAGVRLKFTRQDVAQIARLEGEGGIVASDDAP
ncbi:MAG TPA: XRE family transcriptional regulator [Promineifilum sp.]|nr:XRE family transcriptional regulator [Hyphomicrobium sp.]HRQ15213.1 XRE family transcriptional regulator [Promineifilum sp.]